MATDFQSHTGRGESLGGALRAVRKHRRLGQGQVAKALGMSLRTYVDSEAGSIRWSIEQILAFAEFTQCDQMALLVAIVTGRTALAVRCADNKLMNILTTVIIDFEAVTGERMGDLTTQEMMYAVETVLGILGADLASRGRSEVWLKRMIGRYFGAAG